MKKVIFGVLFIVLFQYSLAAFAYKQEIKLHAVCKALSPKSGCLDVGFITTDIADSTHTIKGSSGEVSNTYSFGPKNFYLYDLNPTHGTQVATFEKNGYAYESSCKSFFEGKERTPKANGTQDIHVTATRQLYTNQAGVKTVVTYYHGCYKTFH